jgi:hypothetical protein
MVIYGTLINESDSTQYWEEWARFWQGVTMQKLDEIEIIQENQQRQAEAERVQRSIGPISTVASITPTSPLSKLPTSSRPAVSAELAKPTTTSFEELALSLIPIGCLDATTAETKRDDDEISLTCRKCNEDFPSHSALLDHAYSNCGGLAQRARHQAKKVIQNVMHTTNELKDRSQRLFNRTVQLCHEFAWDLAVGAVGAAMMVLGLGVLAMLVVMWVVVLLGMLVWWVVVWVLVLLWMLAVGALA